MSANDISPIISLSDFFRPSRAANSAVRSPVLSKFKLIRALMAVLVSCKNEADPFKNEGAGVLTRYVDFSGTQGQLNPQSLVESD